MAPTAPFTTKEACKTAIDAWIAASRCPVTLALTPVTSGGEIYGALGAETVALKQLRRKRSRKPITPPRRALRADPPPPGEGI